MQGGGVIRWGTRAAAAAMPVALGPGDLVTVVAPSSPCARDELWQGLAWLQARYRLRMSPGALARDGYLAGGDDRRREELARAMLDPGVKAIVAARGGYGAMRIVEALPWRDFAARPKWIAGFSDVTALHVAASRWGVASVHGPNVTGLGANASPRTRGEWIAAVERPGAERRWSGLRVLHGGTAEGVAGGGNLSVVHAMAAAGDRGSRGRVVFLEDVGEAPYRVDRMLTSLTIGGYFDGAAAIVFGGFDRCGAPDDRALLDHVLEERTRSLGIPVLAGAPFGHGDRNQAFVLGAFVAVEGRTVSESP